MTRGEGASRRILVTGGSGFVGRHLLAELTENARSGDVILQAGREPDCDVPLDLKDVASVSAAVAAARPDVVLHLAGEASVAQAGNNAAATWQLNLVGTMALAVALGEVSPSATLLFTSSAEVYGRAFLDGVVDETVRPAPSSIYAQAKLAAEQMLAAVLPASATLVVVRPSNHIGPGQDERFALPSFAQQIARAELAGETARIQVGNLDTQRDFMDVRDVVRAYRALVDRFAGTGARETFNISSQNVVPIRTLLEALRGDATVASELIVDPERSRASEVPSAAMDSSRLRETIGWVPAIAIEESARDVLNAARRRQYDIGLNQRTGASPKANAR